MNRSAGYGDIAQEGAATSPDPRTSRQLQAEDELLALLLINTWTLITGRILRSDVPPAELEADELIDFWADDHVGCGSDGYFSAAKMARG